MNNTTFKRPESVTVYCASSTQIAEKYNEYARVLGRLLAENDIRLINGAGNMGLMSLTTDAVLEAGGKATGIIPQFMVDNNWHHTDMTELIIVDSMHERKQELAHRADALIALPGGPGTFEELTEVITMKQLGLINKPIIIVNIDGYYEPLLEMYEQAISEKFMHEAYRKLWQVASTPEEAVYLLLQEPVWDPSHSKFAKM